jgi:25S rRNA (adenine2142-N1)-methyltransferase
MAKKKTKITSLKSGRPPLLQKPDQLLSSKTTRTIIRKHHVLLKAQTRALQSGDTKTAASIEEQLSKDGGLERYQQASQTGQLKSRGGDTSKLLKSWLEESGVLSLGTTSANDQSKRLRILEVGCLAPDNAISKCKSCEVVRIDLNSTHPLIEEQDFMDRALPGSEAERFGIVSLSLVLNFVPDAAQRGEMLERTTKFLLSAPSSSARNQDTANAKTTKRILPALFLTLPLPCVANSRYMTVEHLTAIMASLGYTKTFVKLSAKIFYSLWRYDEERVRSVEFKKKEIAPGRGRNNFCVLLTGK